MLTWYPDFCPSGQCMIELIKELESVTPNPNAGKIWYRYTMTDEDAASVEFDHILSDAERVEHGALAVTRTRIEPDNFYNYVVRWDIPKSVLTLCPHHKALKDAGRTNDEVFKVMLQSCRVKEAARYKIKQDLDLDNKIINPDTGLVYAATGDKYPGIPYRVESDGSFTLGINRLGEKLAELPTRKSEKDALIAAVNAEVDKVAKPTGTSSVRIA